MSENQDQAGASAGSSGGEGGKASGKGGKAAPAAPPARKALFHVVGPGSVHFEGKSHPPGAELNLTEDQADSLGDAVAEGVAPPAPEEIAKRKAGRYVVAGPGSVWSDGKLREKGTVLDLGEEDARTLGASVAPAP